MRLASGTVLGLAAVVSSPALWQGLNGELALDVTLTRYLVAVLVVWVPVGRRGPGRRRTAAQGGGGGAPAGRRGPLSPRDAALTEAG